MSSVLNTCAICQESLEIPLTIKEVQGQLPGEVQGQLPGLEKTMEITYNPHGCNEDPIRTKCDHIFHQNCLNQWVGQYKTRTTGTPCPMCRTELVPAQVVVASGNPDVTANMDLFNLFAVNSLLFTRISPFSETGPHQLMHPLIRDRSRISIMVLPDPLRVSSERESEVVSNSAPPQNIATATDREFTVFDEVHEIMDPFVMHRGIQRNMRVIRVSPDEGNWRTLSQPLISNPQSSTSHPQPSTSIQNNGYIKI